MELIQGDSLKELRKLESSSIDSIITDPPYGLKFMGKKWDYDVPGVDVWSECFRLLRPGGHLLSFGGTRTYHRMAVNIEDAGFEIRDQINWVFGSGFPKGTDVSKAIDRRDGKKEELRRFGKWLKVHRESAGYSKSELDRILGTRTGVSWWEGRKGVYRMPKPDIFSKLKKVLGLDDSFDHLINWSGSKREVIGKRDSRVGKQDNIRFLSSGRIDRIVDITVPSTDDAKEWDGWNTALKPAHEPICVARKPFGGSVDENIIRYRCGAMNIKGCMVGRRRRWPSNVILGHSMDCSEDVCANDCPCVLFPDTKSGTLLSTHSRLTGKTKNTYGERAAPPEECIGDSGSASRFFKGVFFSDEDLRSFVYCSKASRKERDDGGVPNRHPTVKPVELMRYLCKMFTAPGGTILDPYMGSGTTGKGAVLEGFDFIGIDNDFEYVKIAEARIEKSKKNVMVQPGLFDGVDKPR